MNGKIAKNLTKGGSGKTSNGSQDSSAIHLSNVDAKTFLSGVPLEDKVYKIDLGKKQDKSPSWILAGTENLKHPEPRFGASAVCRKDSFVVFGGVSAKGELLNDLWEFNCKSETWNQLTASSGIIGARAFHCAAYIASQDALLILFGRLKNGLSGDIYRFSFKTEAWELLNTHGKIPSERELAAVTLSDNGQHLYAFGGKSTKGKHDDFFRLNLHTFSWEEINTSLVGAPANICDDQSVVPSPPKMQAHVMFFDRGHVLVHGGSYASHFIYDFSVHDAVWRKIPVRGHSLYGREYHSLVQANTAGKFIVLGGFREDITQPKDGQRIQVPKKLECVQTFHFKHQDNLSKHVTFNAMRKSGQMIDLKFLVGKDKSFHCHQLLVQRSPYLSHLIEEAARKQDAKVVTISLPDVSPLVFHDFLTWIYENNLPQIHSIIDLCKLAREYGIYDLVVHCARQFHDKINFKNIIHLFIEVENKQEHTLRLLCQAYIYDHYTKILADTSNVQMLSQVPNLLQEVMLLSRDKRPAEMAEKFPELKNVPQDSFKMFDTYLHSLWNGKRANADLKLVARDSKSFLVHGALLAAQSKVFLDELTTLSRTVMKINADGVILEKIIEFLYKGSIGEGNSVSIELLKDIAVIAHQWVPSVEDWAIEIMLDCVNKDTATTLLSVCRQLRALENIEVLKQVCKQEIANKFTVEELAEIIANLLA